MPWSLYHYEIPRPQKNFHLQESSVNPGDNSGVDSSLMLGSGIQLLWGVQFSPYISLGAVPARMAPTSALLGLEWISIIRKKNRGPEIQEAARKNTANLRSLQLFVQLTSFASSILGPSRGPVSLPSWLLKQMLKKHLGCLDMIGSERRPGLGPGLA